jgi:hypothetical protein
MNFPRFLGTHVFFAAVLIVAGLNGCAGGPRSKTDELTATLRSYEGAIRWGNLTDATAFLDPASAADHPVTQFELDHFAQLTVVGYRTQTATVVDETGTARQQVTIELVNKHTQTPRTILDAQTWRFDAKTKRWLLTSGLPDLDKTVDAQ